MSAQLQAAFVRALMVGFFTALLTLFTTLQQDQSGKEALLAAGIAWVTVILTRGFGEGAYDTSRQNSGNVKPGDVGIQG